MHNLKQKKKIVEEITGVPIPDNDPLDQYTVGQFHHPLSAWLLDTIKREKAEAFDQHHVAQWLGSPGPLSQSLQGLHSYLTVAEDLVAVTLQNGLLRRDEVGWYYAK